MTNLLHAARRRRLPLTVAALAAIAAVALSACGGGVPSGAVAKIGDTVIERETFDH